MKQEPTTKRKLKPKIKELVIKRLQQQKIKAIKTKTNEFVQFVQLCKTPKRTEN